MDFFKSFERLIANQWSASKNFKKRLKMSMFRHRCFNIVLRSTSVGANEGPPDLQHRFLGSVLCCLMYRCQVLAVQTCLC